VTLIDVNVLVYAHREDAPGHPDYAAWLKDTLSATAPFGIADVVLSGFLRVVTHPRIFSVPTPMPIAVAFARGLRGQSNCVVVAPGDHHWDIFTSLCETAGVKGNLVADAYLAALAIESGCEWVTTDRDYSRFPGLRWRHPISAG
jgi:toxin-antitoxin system PIN domain toxin